MNGPDWQACPLMGTLDGQTVKFPECPMNEISKQCPVAWSSTSPDMSYITLAIWQGWSSGHRTLPGDFLWQALGQFDRDALCYILQLLSAYNTSEFATCIPTNLLKYNIFTYSHCYLVHFTDAGINLISIKFKCSTCTMWILWYKNMQHYAWNCLERLLKLVFINYKFCLFLSVTKVGLRE